jgi:hypothetical protein
MKRINIIFVLMMLTRVAFAQSLPGDPGSQGVAVPLDGGVLIALLAGATVAISSFRKKKNKDKQE